MMSDMLAQIADEYALRNAGVSSWQACNQYAWRIDLSFCQLSPALDCLFILFQAIVTGEHAG